MSTRSNPLENLASAEPKPDLSSFKPGNRTGRVNGRAIVFSRQVADQHEAASKHRERSGEAQVSPFSSRSA
jgi:hypothetical protein